MKGIRWHGHPRSAGNSHGFTLIELLVVIAIIGVLVALLVPVALGAIAKAKAAAISVEVGEIAKALQQFKIQYGTFPPDFSLANSAPGGQQSPDAQQLEQFLTRNFRARDANRDRFINPNNKNGHPFNWTDLGLDPSEALFFWLGVIYFGRLIPEAL